jgi:hypothetical protein
MKKFSDFIKEDKCQGILNIQAINDHFNYEDKKGGGGSAEWDLLSCGQDGSYNGYNELQRFYDTYLEDKLDGGLANHLVVMNLLCECCHEISHENRTHKAFKECVSKKLGVKIV